MPQSGGALGKKVQAGIVAAKKLAVMAHDVAKKKQLISRGLGALGYKGPAAVASLLGYGAKRRRRRKRRAA